MKLFIDKLFSLAGEKKLIAKIISIFLALVLWGYIYDSKTGRMKFEAQIEFINLPAQFIVTNPSIKILTVNIDGKKDYIKNIDIKTLRPTVNLENPKIDEEWVYQIGINRQQIPDSINISLSTDKVRLTVERQAQKRVRIMPVLKGELPDGYVAGRIKTVPDSVVITGARSLLEKISYINTDPIALDNVSTVKLI
jgi:YbbR domain-containing protein